MYYVTLIYGYTIVANLFSVYKECLFRCPLVNRSFYKNGWTRPLRVTWLTVTGASWTWMRWRHRLQTDVTCSPDMTSSLTAPCRSTLHRDLLEHRSRQIMSTDLLCPDFRRSERYKMMTGVCPSVCRCLDLTRERKGLGTQNWQDESQSLSHG